MTHPRVPTDLTLAPVAVAIDQNLQYLRSLAGDELLAGLELETDRPSKCPTRAERATLVVSAALRNVNLHGWNAQLTDDGSRIHLDGGSVTLDIGLSTAIAAYVGE
jgi:hypothetical protein